MDWEEEDTTSMARELTEAGLATPNPYEHLTLNPALCPYLRGQMDVAQVSTLTARWGDAMRAYVKLLRRNQAQHAELVATLTMLELPNLFALLEQVERAGDAEATIDLASSLFGLLPKTGKPRLLERLAKARDAAEEALGATWNHATFEAQRIRVDEQLASSRFREALEGAKRLLERARAADESSYREATYDLATACFILGRVFTDVGKVEQALPLYEEAQKRFESFESADPGRGAEEMASRCVTERGTCLRYLGRIEQAAAAYNEGILRAEKKSDARSVAVGKGQLGTIRMIQGRHADALQAFKEARALFARLDEPSSVAIGWHQTGMAHQRAGEPGAAEDAYRKSLAIEVMLGNVAGQATTLIEFGNLYGNLVGQSEEAAAFYRQAADKFVEIGDVANEGLARSNLSRTLRELGRLDDARREVLRAIECNAPFGHRSRPWATWAVVADIEKDAGNAAAAEKAKRKAITYYLAYRRDGGENQGIDGRICLGVTQCLVAGDPSGAASQLKEFAAYPELPARVQPLIQTLEAIIAGSRDRALADAPGLNCIMAAEILFLLETLEKHQ